MWKVKILKNWTMRNICSLNDAGDYLRDTAPHCPWSDCSRGWFPSLSIWSKKRCEDLQDREIRDVHVAICECSRQRLNAVVSDLIGTKIHSGQCLREENDDVNEVDKKSMICTLLFIKISDKYLAPWSPMWFLERSSSASIYVKKIEWKWDR